MLLTPTVVHVRASSRADREHDGDDKDGGADQDLGHG
jgi:hypothetical protein